MLEICTEVIDFSVIGTFVDLCRMHHHVTEYAYFKSVRPWTKWRCLKRTWKDDFLRVAP
jgi:hypothetical protein